MFLKQFNSKGKKANTEAIFSQKTKTDQQVQNWISLVRASQAPCACAACADLSDHCLWQTRRRPIYCCHCCRTNPTPLTSMSPLFMNILMLKKGQPALRDNAAWQRHTAATSWAFTPFRTNRDVPLASLTCCCGASTR